MRSCKFQILHFCTDKLSSFRIAVSYLHMRSSAVFQICFSDVLYLPWNRFTSQLARRMANNMSTDPEFEYDAPKYIDFNLLQQGHLEDDDADTWFGKETSPTSLLLPTSSLVGC